MIGLPEKIWFTHQKSIHKQNIDLGSELQEIYSLHLMESRGDRKESFFSGFQKFSMIPGTAPHLTSEEIQTHYLAIE